MGYLRLLPVGLRGIAFWSGRYFSLDSGDIRRLDDSRRSLFFVFIHAFTLLHAGRNRDGQRRLLCFDYTYRATGVGGLAVDYPAFVFLLNLPICVLVLGMLATLPRPPFEPARPLPRTAGYLWFNINHLICVYHHGPLEAAE